MLTGHRTGFSVRASDIGKCLDCFHKLNSVAEIVLSTFKIYLLCSSKDMKFAVFVVLQVHMIWYTYKLKFMPCFHLHESLQTAHKSKIQIS